MNWKKWLGISDYNHYDYTEPIEVQHKFELEHYPTAGKYYIRVKLIEIYTTGEVVTSDEGYIVSSVKGVYTKDDENDPWVDYVNVKTLQEYSCRQAAFLSRFSRLPDSN